MSIDSIPDLYESMSANKFLAPLQRQRTRDRQREKNLKRFLNPLPFDVVYRRYMESRRWKRFRRAIIKQRGSMCERCGKTPKVLHVHHLRYLRLGHELNEDVLVLCVPCHQKRHMDKPGMWK